MSDYLTTLNEGEADLLWHTVIRSDLDDLARRCAVESIVEKMFALRLERIQPKHTARPPHPDTMAGR